MTMHPATLFIDIEDTLRKIILRFDALEIAESDQSEAAANHLSTSCRILVQKLEYDRACGTQIDWDETHKAAVIVTNAWMRCMLNGVQMKDQDYDDLMAAINAAREHLTASFT